MNTKTKILIAVGISITALWIIKVNVLDNRRVDSTKASENTLVDLSDARFEYTVGENCLAREKHVNAREIEKLTAGMKAAKSDDIYFDLLKTRKKLDERMRKSCTTLKRNTVPLVLPQKKK